MIRLFAKISLNRVRMMCLCCRENMRYAKLSAVNCGLCSKSCTVHRRKGCWNEIMEWRHSAVRLRLLERAGDTGPIGGQRPSTMGRTILLRETLPEANFLQLLLGTLNKFRAMRLGRTADR
ncbi:unnamed protein product [Cyclocybe aegerita]|uniref:Uncharacterized protein n=1 Tax=Cyclocybe aegerita TaxID=1973307 RepID=A0A8S0VRQ7_CYCAE|nr:unnamed protein product [Cyclocybe aegerita]